MNRVLVFFAAIFIASAAAAATISGSVVDEGSGAGLSGMTVQAWTPEGALVATASSDVTGSFSLAVTPAGYRLLAYDNSGFYATNFYDRAESFETSSIIAVTTNGLSGVRLVLERSGFIEGTVAAKDKSPIEDAIVTVYNQSGTPRAFTATDAAGHYLVAVPGRTYKIAAWDGAGAYLPSFFSNQSTFVTATQLSVVAEATSTANFQLSKAATLAGTVTADASPIAANVSIYRATGELLTTTTAGADGKFAVRVPAGTYRVVIFDANGVYAPVFWRSGASFDASDAIAVAEGESRTDLDASLMRAGHFSGTVRDASAGAVLPSMTVAAFNGDGSMRAFATTDAVGHYVLVVPPGAYRVAAYDDSLIHLRRFYPAETSFAWAPEWSLSASQEATLDFSLPRGSVVAGIVRDAVSGAALAGMTVAAYDESGAVATSMTDASGAYKVLLESGAFELAAHDPQFHYATSTRSIAAVAGSAIDNENFEMSVGVHLSGRITSTSGAPIPNAILAEYDGGGAVIASATSRADGTYDLASPAGTFSFAAYDPSHHFQSSAPTNGLAVHAGQTIAGFNFVLAPSERSRAISR